MSTSDTDTTAPSPAATQKPKASKKKNKLVFLSEGFERVLREYNQSPTIHALMTLSSAPTKSSLNSTITNLLTTYPLFRSTISWGKRDLFWNTPEEIGDPEAYIKYTALDIDSPTTESIDKAHKEYISSCIGKQLPSKRGNWELHVITYQHDGEEGKVERCDLLWRLHHAIGDGILLMEVIINVANSFDYSELGTETETEDVDEIKVEEVDVSDENALRNIKKPTTRRRKPNALISVIKSLCKVAMLPISRPDPTTVFKAKYDKTKGKMKKVAYDENENSEEGIKRKKEKEERLKKSFRLGANKTFAQSTLWDVNEAKSAGYAFNATVNDVTMAAISGALRRYCIEKSDPVVLKAKKNFTIRALAVVNTRVMNANSREQMLTDFKNCKSANEFSYLIPNLPLGDLTNEERVKACHETFFVLKNSPEPILLRGVNDVLRKYLGGAFTIAFNRKLILNKFSCLFSNLQGPEKEIKVAGARVETLSNFVQPMAYGMTISIQSYAGSICVNICSDCGLVPDPELITRYADECFAEICQLAYEKNKEKLAKEKEMREKEEEKAKANKKRSK